MSDYVERTLARRLAGVLRVPEPWVFARELLHQPSAVGAIWPSSRRLAASMAARVPRHRDGLVVELGAGTGAVTRALLKRGIAPRRLVVIDKSLPFVRHLRARFPSVRVLQGDAARLSELLPEGQPIDAIVSSLPLRSLPAKDAAAIVAQWARLLPTGATVIQFTYALGARVRSPLPGFLERTSDIVWANLPPARVLALECYRGNPRVASAPGDD
jgi:phospholipid N-methyltransferase